MLLTSYLGKEDKEIKIFEAYQNTQIVETLENDGEVFIVLEDNTILEIFDSLDKPYQYNILSKDITIDPVSLEIDYDNFLLDGGVIEEDLGSEHTVEQLVL